MYVCAPCACSSRRGQKRVSDPLALEFLMIASHHVCGWWELNLDLLKEQQMFLITESSLQTQV